MSYTIMRPLQHPDLPHLMITDGSSWLGACVPRNDQEPRYTTFPPSYNDYSSLIRFGLFQSEISEICLWVKSQSWHNHVGVGYNDGLGSLFMPFVLVCDERDLVMLKLKCQ